MSAKTNKNRSKKTAPNRRFNFRFAAVILVSLLACAGLAHGVRMLQLDRNAEHVLRRAQRLSGEGNVQAAIRDYSRYLKQRPDDLDALSEMAQLLEETAVSYENLVQVYLTYEGILREDVHRDDIRRRTVDVSLRLQKYTTALEHLELLQEKVPKGPENFFEIGQCYEGQGEHKRAAAQYLEAIKHGPSHIEYYLRLVRLLNIHGEEYQEEELEEIDLLSREQLTHKQVAETFMDEVVAKGKPRFEAYLSRANYRKEQGELVRAAEDMQQALELAGGKTDVILAAADLSLDRAAAAEAAGQTDDAGKHYRSAAQTARDGLQIDGADLRFFLTLSRVELASERREEAVGVLREGIRRYETVSNTKSKSGQQNQHKLSTAKLKLLHNQLLFSLADLLITLADSETGNPDAAKLTEAVGVIAQLPTNGPLAALAKFLDARMQIVNRQWRQALKILQSTEAIQVPLTNLRRRITLETVRCYEFLRNPDAQLNVLRRAVSRDPLWNEGRIAVAATLADGNRIDEAIREYRLFRHVPGVPTIIVRLMIVRELSRPIERRNWAGAQQMLETAIEVMPGSPEIPVLQAELLMQQKDGYAKASALLKIARGEQEDNVEVAASSARVEMSRTDSVSADRYAEASKILDDAESKLGDQVEFRLVRAELAATQDFDAAVADLQKLEAQLSAFSNRQRYQLLSGLARVYAKKGATSHARRVWRQLSKSHPQNLMVWLVLLRFAADSNDDKTRQDLLREVRRIEGPAGPNGNYEEATAILDILRREDRPAKSGTAAKLDAAATKKKLDHARVLLTQAAEVRTNWPAVPRAIGVLEDLAGNSNDAFIQFQRAIALGDYSREVISRVVRGLYLRKRYNEADSELKRLQTAQPDVITGDIARLAWRVAWQKRQFDRALGIADELTREKFGSFKDDIWKAQLNFARGLRGKEDVEQPLIDAVTDDEGKRSPASWFALVAYLNRVGRTENAIATIGQAETTLPKTVASLTAARCFEMVGESKQAELHYVQASKDDPKNVMRLISVADFYTRQGASKKAGPYLKQILSPEVAATEFARAWARRREALLLAGGGGYSERINALATLDRNIGRNNANAADVVADLRAKALLLSSNQNRRDRLAAIKVYEEIAERQTLTVTERFRLAQLYDLTGDWDKARDLLVNLIGGESVAGSHLAYYISALVRRDQLGDAQVWMEKLKQFEPHTFRTIATQARMLAALDRAAEAVPLVTAHIDKRRTAAESLTDLLAQQNAKEVLSILESSLRDQLGRRGAQTILQARELLASNESAQAISLLTEYIDKTRLAVASQAVLYRLAAKLCEEIGQVEPAERFFEKYVAESDNSRAVFLQATFLARQARLEEALAICRKAQPDTDPNLFVSAAASVIGHGKPTKPQLDEVRSWIENVLGESPNSSAATIALGDLYLVERRFDDAEIAYRRVLGRNERNVTALNNLAWLLAYEKRELDEAAKLIERAIDYAGPVAALLDTRAMIHLAAGRAEEAIEDLTEAFVNTVSPYSAIGHVHLAMAYQQAGDRESSEQMLNRSKQYGLRVVGMHPQERETYENVVRSLK